MARGSRFVEAQEDNSNPLYLGFCFSFGFNLGSHPAQHQGGTTLAKFLRLFLKGRCCLGLSPKGLSPSPLQKGRAYPQSIWTVMIIGDTHLTLPRYQGLCQVQSRIQGVACLTERELAWRPLQVGGGDRNPRPGWSYSACALSSVS